MNAGSNVRIFCLFKNKLLWKKENNNGLNCKLKYLILA